MSSARRRSKRLTKASRPQLADPRAVAGFRPQWKEMVYPLITDARRARASGISTATSTSTSSTATAASCSATRRSSSWRRHRNSSIAASPSAAVAARGRGRRADLRADRQRARDLLQHRLRSRDGCDPRGAHGDRARQDRLLRRRLSRHFRRSPDPQHAARQRAGRAGHSAGERQRTSWCWSTARMRRSTTSARTRRRSPRC